MCLENGRSKWDNNKKMWIYIFCPQIGRNQGVTEILAGIELRLVAIGEGRKEEAATLSQGKRTCIHAG